MENRRIEIDFSHSLGKIKPVNGMRGIPYLDEDSGFSLIDIYRDFSTPVILFSAADADSSIAVDLHTVFPDIALDERFFESYNFVELDRALKDAKSIGAEIILRLGQTARPIGKRPYLRLPFSTERIARIFTRIIAHCNCGFAGGFKLGIKRVEIWQSPDYDYGFFSTPTEYFELYRVVSKKIKEDFPKIKVGAYSSGGFASLNRFAVSDKEKSYVDYLDNFLSYIKGKETSAPLDFLSWHCYPETPEELAIHSNYARSYLSHHGFKRAESIISAFSPSVGKRGVEYLDKRYPALLASCLITAVKSDISMMMYSDPHPASMRNALYSQEDRCNVHRYASYSVMMAFGRLASSATVVETSEDYRHEIYSLATVTESAGHIIIATRDFEGILELIPMSHEYKKYSIEGVRGGGERGAGFSTKAENIQFAGKIKLRVGKNEVYALTLLPQDC